MRTGLGVGIVLTSPKCDKLKYMLQIHFAASNNMAEYEALVLGLRLAKEIGIRRVLCYSDSDLAVIPTDIEFDSPRITMYMKAEAKEAREDGVDLLEEGRLLALSWSAIYQQGLRHYHSRKVKP
ncbi:uncharacterized protein [Aegilops tauschii subsp. strangulata]|uniref:uncharacterized protein n=1 Tax=Aegilops tauschii subsp. strangulata TaxID=200361 RepID=UPI003CC84A06